MEYGKVDQSLAPNSVQGGDKMEEMGSKDMQKIARQSCPNTRLHDYMPVANKNAGPKK